MNTLLDFARFFASCGYSPVPVALDGTKRPPEGCGWKRSQQAIAAPGQIRRWFESGLVGIALIQGHVSGGPDGLHAELLEFESEPFYQAWASAMIAAGHGDLGRRLNLRVRSGGGGIHVYYRHAGEPRGNKTLAGTAAPIGKHKPDKNGFTTCIETRGEGGYIVAPGSPAEVHETGNPYKLLTGSFRAVPVVSADERETLWEMARSLCERPKEQEKARPRFEARVFDSSGMRPGEDFDTRGGVEAMACLERHGWTVLDRMGEGVTLVRPGKGKGQGSGATFGVAAPNLLHVFTSNAAPFEAEGNYGPFAILTRLDFGGDFAACAKHLASLGYGSQAVNNQTKRPAPKVCDTAPSRKRWPFMTNASCPAPIADPMADLKALADAMQWPEEVEQEQEAPNPEKAAAGGSFLDYVYEVFGDVVDNSPPVPDLLKRLAIQTREQARAAYQNHKAMYAAVMRATPPKGWTTDDQKGCEEWWERDLETLRQAAGV